MKTTKGEVVAYRLREGVIVVSIRSGRNGFMDVDLTDEQASGFSEELNRAMAGKTSDVLRNAVATGESRDD